MLPIELLELLLKHVLDEGSYDDFMNALCVDSTWHATGTRLLWSHVVLRNVHQVLKFSCLNGNRHLSQLKSLSIRIRPPFLWEKEYDDANTTRLSQSLQSLAPILPALTSLTTFSFYVATNGQEFAPPGLAIRRCDLYQILNLLPPTVKNLEIDTKAREQNHPDDENLHVCDLLKERLPHLISLRLRLRRICPSLLTQSKSLRDITISMVTCFGWTDARECLDPEEDQIGDWPPHKQAIGKSTRRSLVTTMQGMKDKMPNLEHAVLFDAEYMDTFEEKQAVHSLRKRDFMTNTTTVWPLFRLHKVIYADEDYDRRISVLRVSQKGDGHPDIIGNISDLEEYVEGPTWAITTKGSRFPPRYKDSCGGRDLQWDTAHDVWKRDELPDEPTFVCEMWVDEARAERSLIHAFTSEGLGEGEPLLRNHFVNPDQSVLYDSEDEAEGDYYWRDFHRDGPDFR